MYNSAGFLDPVLVQKLLIQLQDEFLEERGLSPDQFKSIYKVTLEMGKEPVILPSEFFVTTDVSPCNNTSSEVAFFQRILNKGISSVVYVSLETKRVGIDNQGNVTKLDEFTIGMLQAQSVKFLTVQPSVE